MPLSFNYCSNPFLRNPSAVRHHAMNALGACQGLPQKGDASKGAFWKVVQAGVSSDKQVPLDRRGYAFVFNMVERLDPEDETGMRYVFHVQVNSRVLGTTRYYLYVVDKVVANGKDTYVAKRVVKASAPNPLPQDYGANRPINNPFGGGTATQTVPQSGGGGGGDFYAMSGGGGNGDGGEFYVINRSDDEDLYNNSPEPPDAGSDDDHYNNVEPLDGLYNNVA